MPKRKISQIGKAQIALIHVAKAQVGMSEETYRAMLGSVGVSSSKDLDQGRFDELMQRFESSGFRSTGARGKGQRKKRPRAVDGRAPLMGKIGAILADTGLPWSYADGIAKKMFGIDAVRFCEPPQLWRVAAALSIYQKRKEKKGGDR